MWDCEHCGQTNITEGVPFCPSCYVPRAVPARAEPAEVSVAADSAAPPADNDTGKAKK